MNGKKLSALLTPHNALMAVCVGLMFAFVSYALPNSAEGSVWLALAPLGLCLLMHVLLHRFMGSSCHKEKVTAENDADPSRPSPIPLSLPPKLRD